MRFKNEFDGERVHVQGHFVHRIAGGGSSTELVSAPVDTVLSPLGRQRPPSNTCYQLAPTRSRALS